MKKIKIAGMILGIFGVACIIGLAITGWKINWGPFRFLHTWEGDIKAIEKEYSTDCQGEVVFYGASNFALWDQLDEDLAEYGYTVQNHAFGGSTDEDLMEYADRLLYPYQPSVIVLQTGSNDYVNMLGTDREKVDKCVSYKKKMYETFHQNVPNAHIVIMSGLLLPGRSEYTTLTKMVNEELKSYAETVDYLHFVDAEEMTYDGFTYREDLFRKDRIHLNHTGELLWCEEYIVPALEEISLIAPDILSESSL
ncbi:MAG: GDSL-type esterase/lipase family protein [Lachnospiraceae bacterium]|nr:GDSL-type esterase/lipase family protein [Lachnospiraceae bacterium]